MAKLIFLNRYYYPDHSATSQLLADLTRHLAARGLEIHVVTSRQLYNNPAAALPAQDRLEQVVIHRLTTSRCGRGGLWGRALDYVTFYIQAVRRMARLIEPGDLVVAETDPPLISVCAALVCRWRHGRLINWIQDLFPEVAAALGVGGEGLGYRLLKALRNWSLRTAVYNVVLGDRMRDRLVAEGVHPERIGVIPNWADGDALRPVAHAANPLRATWELENRFVVGYSGNMGRAHEFDTLLQAADLLRDIPQIVFLLIGDGAQRDRLIAEATRRGLPQIRFQPYQPREQLAVSLGVADVHLVSLAPPLEGLIVPSKFYGIAAAGRPTIFIGDERGEVASILKRHRCGLTVRVGDAERLAACILELSRTPARTQEMGHQARRAFRKRWDKPLAFAAWEKVVLSTLARHSSGSDGIPNNPDTQEVANIA